MKYILEFSYVKTACEAEDSDFKCVAVLDRGFNGQKDEVFKKAVKEYGWPTCYRCYPEKD